MKQADDVKTQILFKVRTQHTTLGVDIYMNRMNLKGLKCLGNIKIYEN